MTIRKFPVVKKAKFWLSLCLSLAALLAVILSLSACSSFGATAEGERLAKMQASAQWTDTGFENSQSNQLPGGWRIALEAWRQRSQQATPEEPLPTRALGPQDFQRAADAGLKATWLGHSSVLIDIDGTRVLLDPIWGERASPFSWLGPRRWYASPLPLEALPEIDAILISHDHYDHLDHYTVQQLKNSDIRWFVPLGVGAHLAHWGVAEHNIVELDWWQAETVGTLRITATPARHFSGRTLRDRKPNGGPTLWASWSIIGDKHRVFFSGDTGFFDGFKDIGDKLGPFDLTLMEVGAYNSLWADVHMGPEQAVLAHQLLRGRTMMPVHWGLFDLALHGWTEPAERLLAAAEVQALQLALPIPGETLDLSRQDAAETSLRPAKRWWPSLPWRSAEEDPVVSSGVHYRYELPIRTDAKHDSHTADN